MYYGRSKRLRVWKLINYRFYLYVRLVELYSKTEYNKIKRDASLSNFTFFIRFVFSFLRCILIINRRNIQRNWFLADDSILYRMLY